MLFRLLLCLSCWCTYIRKYSSLAPTTYKSWNFIFCWVYGGVIQILVVQLSFVCGKRKTNMLFSGSQIRYSYSSVTFENKRFSTSNAGSMVVKLFDSLVHGCYSGSYFVEIHFIIWPLRGGYSWGTQGRRFYDFIFRFDSLRLICQNSHSHHCFALHLYLSVWNLESTIQKQLSGRAATNHGKTNPAHIYSRKHEIGTFNWKITVDKT